MQKNKYQKVEIEKVNFDSSKRIVITNILPEIDCGKFPSKHCIHEPITIKSTIFMDGHDELASELCYRHQNEQNWQKEKNIFLGNDRWKTQFIPSKIGNYEYFINAWLDELRTWEKMFLKKWRAEQNVQMELLMGLEIITNSTIDSSYESIKQQLTAFIISLKEKEKYGNETIEQLKELINHFAPGVLPKIKQTSQPLTITIDRKKAIFSTWYELFPRSWSETPNQHGNFKDVIKRLPYIHAMGFDTIYLPPIHPIGTTKRKGKNNATTATATDPGSPWGIGSQEGGHTAIHSNLGTLADLHELIKEMDEYGMELALDFALQCSPDHPYLTKHPEWFKKRPDGSLQYAENPPKKYEDIYPLNFETKDWQSLWEESKKIILFWVKQGIKIFRVDNPHTKPFLFWQWLIEEVKKENPDVIFLAEAFTRPSVMYHLAKIGFSQSYTYFTWRNNKEELISYFEELTTPPICYFFRPNLWPNTPDILHQYLQEGGKAGFIIRLVLAATLGSSYGIYGPAYELCINIPLKEGSEEYLNSEKYEIKDWNLNQESNIQKIVMRINHIRRNHTALQKMNNLKFHHCDNPNIICYSKKDSNLEDVLIIIVNLDFRFTQSGFVYLPIKQLGIKSDAYSVYDLLTSSEYYWTGEKNYVELNPHKMPAHIFQIKEH